MKIITENAAYVLKNDIVYLFQTGLHELTFRFIKNLGDGTIIDDRNKYEFIKYDSLEEIEFLENANWMVDYNEVKDLSEEAIIALSQRIAKRRNVLVQRIDSIPYEELEENMDLVTEKNLLDFKMHSLEEILLFKQGHIRMELPEGVDLPEGVVQENRIRQLIKKEHEE